ncbi:MAG: Hsp20/alpha crystallin family protein [Nitrososphaeria archaeon]
MGFPEDFDSLWEDVEGCLEPLVELRETHSAFEVYVDLPYVRGESIEVRFSEDALLIMAECSKVIRFERWGFAQKRMESKYFRKVIKLPHKIDPKKVTSSFKNGVLKIRVLKV